MQTRLPSPVKTEMMTDWFTYWNSAQQVREKEPLKQVGKTVNGVPITEEQFAVLVEDVRQKLELSPTDAVLDLCCGNGALTFELSKSCERITGIDFSAPLLEVASSHFTAHGVSYILCDVCHFPAELKKTPFSKICLYEGLQHLRIKQVRDLMVQIDNLPGPKPLILFGSVPDADRIWAFYDTPERRADYEERKLKGTEAIGHWWERQLLSELMIQHGYETTFLLQHPAMHGAHYRMDVLCRAMDGDAK
jgi:cyclopropane fatty-acyl-phospholipid synthase-like methyltransferase